MAEVTSGNVTVIILSDEEVASLRYLLIYAFTEVEHSVTYQEDVLRLHELRDAINAW